MRFFFWFLAVTALCITAALMYAATQFPTPFLARHSNQLFALLVACSSFILLCIIGFRRKLHGFSKLFYSSIGLCALLTLGLLLNYHLNFSTWKKSVYSSDSKLVQRLGQHFIIGYQDDEEIQQLVKSGAGVLASLKHFPGLGDVQTDTHREFAHLSTEVNQLERHDWLPFREISRKPNATIMVGHLHLDTIDKDSPASVSRPVLQTIIRNDWGYQGILITDDLTMSGIYQKQNNHLQTTA